MGELLLEIKENEVEMIIGMFEIKILFIFVLSFIKLEMLLAIRKNS